MSTVTRPPHGDAETIASNLHRLMAQDGLTFDQVVEATALDERTVRALARGATRPHARTLHKLSQGLGVAVEELFRRPVVSARRFDRRTNPEIDHVVSEYPERFARWAETDFDELYSQFGTGGTLSEAGVLAAAEAINAKRELLQKVNVVLESSDADLLAELVNLLYRRVTFTEDPSGGAARSEADELPALRIHHLADHRDR